MDNIRCASQLSAQPQISKVAWTTTPADYNVVTNGPGGSAAPVNGRCCRWVSCVTAGTLNYTTWDGTAGSIEMVAGFLYPCPAKTLVAASTTAQKVTVFW